MMKNVYAGLVAGLTYLFGPPDKMMVFLAVLLIANYFYGFFTTKGSKKEFTITTVKRYIGYAGLMFIGNQIDQAQVFASIGFDASVRFLLVIYMIAKEARRFLQFLELLGVETPAFLDAGLKQVEERTAQSTPEYEQLATRLNQLEERVQFKKAEKEVRGNTPDVVAGPDINEEYRGDM